MENANSEQRGEVRNVVGRANTDQNRNQDDGQKYRNVQKEVNDRQSGQAASRHGPNGNETRGNAVNANLLHWYRILITCRKKLIKTN